MAAIYHNTAPKSVRPFNARCTDDMDRKIVILVVASRINYDSSSRKNSSINSNSIDNIIIVTLIVVVASAVIVQW